MSKENLIKIAKYIIYKIECLLLFLNEVFVVSKKDETFNQSIFISIVCPLYNTPKFFLKEMIKSVLNQSYPNFELCLVDASEEGKNLLDIISMFDDSRIKYIKLNDNYGIADNTNSAIEASSGDYIVFLDHDDVLSKEALMECSKVIIRNEDIDFIYSDEDQFRYHILNRKNPFYKPDYSKQYLWGLNYICHLVCIKRSLLRQVGSLRSEFDGSQDYDFVLRATQLAKKIYHIPKILYHWRVHKGSVAHSFGTKNYAQAASISALNEYFEQCYPLAGMNVSKTEISGRYNSYSVNNVQSVSVLIYVDEVDLNEKIIEELEGISSGLVEIIVLGKTYSSIEGVIYLKKIYNNKFHAYNEGAKIATGDVLFFLSSDLTLFNISGVKSALAMFNIKTVGVVGSKLLVKSKTISTGYALEVNQLKLLGSGLNRNSRGYYDKNKLMHNVSAVNVLGMLTRKKTFIERGMFSKLYYSNGADVQYCIDLRKDGYEIVLYPKMEIYLAKEREITTFSVTDYKTLIENNYDDFSSSDEYSKMYYGFLNKKNVEVI